MPIGGFQDPSSYDFGGTDPKSKPVRAVIEGPRRPNPNNPERPLVTDPTTFSNRQQIRRDSEITNRLNLNNGREIEAMRLVQPELSTRNVLFVTPVAGSTPELLGTASAPVIGTKPDQSIIRDEPLAGQQFTGSNLLNRNSRRR